MQSFAIRAYASDGFRLTLDLSAWADVGVSLPPAILRLRALTPGAAADAPAALEIATGAANAALFDPLTGLATFCAPASATAALAGVYPVAGRAEFAGYAVRLFGGSITFLSDGASPGAQTPQADTAWIAAHPFGPAPAPAPLAAAAAAAQAAARSALIRSFIYGG